MGATTPGVDVDAGIVLFTTRVHPAPNNAQLTTTPVRERKEECNIEKIRLDVAGSAIFQEILLMIVLGTVKLLSRHNFCNDRHLPDPRGFECRF